jgi:type IV secretion system pilin
MIDALTTKVLTHFSAACTGGSFLGFPHWYEYLNGQTIPAVNDVPAQCVPQISSISDIWLIVAAIVDMLLRLAGLVSIAFVIYGGIMFITSQGDPGKTNKARQTIINALIGVSISIVATIVVTFIAGQFKEA